ncbi:uncharacterized protein LOC135081912 [Ostrinia nubilalis]|uniref:uncharacterized protein LOC135081912 n=1 Tax=Ostrinia nubilalis TaxID=29057 RepID=UPI0030822B11
MLLGAEIYSQILVDGVIKGPVGSPVAQNTTIGWILSGQIQSESLVEPKACHHNIVSMHTQLNETEILRKFWELEAEPSSKKQLTEEEKLCEEIFTKTTTRDPTGRYIVKLPFRNEDPQCQYGNSNLIAAKRLQMLERRLDRDPNLKQQYSDVIAEYIELGHMEIVPVDQQDKALHTHPKCLLYLK